MLTSCFDLFNPWKERHDQFNRMLGGTNSTCGCFGEKKTPLVLPGIEVDLEGIGW